MLVENVNPVNVFGRNVANAKGKPMYEILDPRFRELIDEGETLTALRDGFRFLEGPAWDHKLNRLYFNDIPGNAGYFWEAERGVVMFRPNSYLANGNTLDRQGRLLTCEHGTSRVTRTDSGGVYETMASHYRGRELNSPNDIVVRSNGMIYFTDPNPGRMPRVGIPRRQELPFQGVFMLNPESKELTLLADHLSKPNGLCFDRDETRLFVNDTDAGLIHRFPVKPDGTLGTGEVWTKLTGRGKGVADGMKIDSLGNLYCSGPDGIHVYDADARPLGTILTPEVCANFTWGGDGFQTIFMAATSSLYALRVQCPGRPLY